MTSSGDALGRESWAIGGLLAVILCGILVAGFMPLALAPVEVVEMSQPPVPEIERPLVVELLPDPPMPDISNAGPARVRLRAPVVPREAQDDATAQNSRLFERLREIDARERGRKPRVNPLRDPDMPPKRRGAAELLLDEFP